MTRYDEKTARADPDVQDLLVALNPLGGTREEAIERVAAAVETEIKKNGLKRLFKIGFFRPH
jgi:hypothetical protein